ncbi:MAG: hypothetical protein ACHBN1_29335 [Heteroscytonema crispum UTEX LB 1556]
MKLDGASGAENNGILTKAPPGFEPGDKGLETSKKLYLIILSAFVKSFYPTFTPVAFCDRRKPAPAENCQQPYLAVYATSIGYNTPKLDRVLILK